MNNEFDDSNPRIRSLKLKTRAAEEGLEAARIYSKIAHIESVAAKLLVRRLKQHEQYVTLMMRGKHYHSRMKDHEAHVAEREQLKAILEPEIDRKRDKATKLVSQAKIHERKKNEIEQRIRSLLEEAGKLKKTRDSHLIQSKKLEAEAVRIESMF